LRKELETVQERVTSSVSPEDWHGLKQEVETLQAYRLKHPRSETKSKIDNVKVELEKTMNLTKKSESRNTELKSELKNEFSSLNILLNRCKLLRRTRRPQVNCSHFVKKLTL
jgi:hypothetical protein